MKKIVFLERVASLAFEWYKFDYYCSLYIEKCSKWPTGPHPVLGLRRENGKQIVKFRNKQIWLQSSKSSHLDLSGVRKVNWRASTRPVNRTHCFSKGTSESVEFTCIHAGQANYLPNFGKRSNRMNEFDFEFIHPKSSETSKQTLTFGWLSEICFSVFLSVLIGVSQFR